MTMFCTSGFGLFVDIELSFPVATVSASKCAPDVCRLAHRNMNEVCMILGSN